MKFILPGAFFVLCFAGLFADETAAQNKSGDQADAILGDWHGTSTCLVKPSACHDEEALYHVKPASGKTRLSMQADKIVDGQPVRMGTADCSYDAEKRFLHCDFARGSIDLTLAGDPAGGRNVPDGQDALARH